MGTSFTSFNGFGFWSRDGCLVAWMGVLVSKIDEVTPLAADQQAFRDDLILQGSLQVGGAVHDCLRHVVNSESLRIWAHSIGKQALREFIVSGDFLDGRWLNELLRASGSVDAGDHFKNGPIPSEYFIDYGEKWLRLLDGNFTPLPLHPSGKYYGNGEIEIDIVARHL